MEVHTIVNSAANGGKRSDNAPITVKIDAASTKLFVTSGELTETAPRRYKTYYTITALDQPHIFVEPI